MHRHWLTLIALWLLCAAPLSAQDIPAPLRDWQGWVLHDMPDHACPFLPGQQPDADSRQCAWPGQLTLTADSGGGQFTLAVQVDAPSWVALPGDARHWPQQVTANQQPAIVLAHAGQPSVRLQPGSYLLRGALPWTARPAQLRVPDAIALIALTLDGSAVTRIERNGNQLTLGEAAAAQRAADALSLRVYRRLQDGLPAMLETRLQLNVTGSAREQLLGPVLPAGFVATALGGELPARLDADGRLRVQLRPGAWTLTLAARATTVPGKLAIGQPPAPWPTQEIWSYADDSGLRTTRVEGSPTDAAQAGVPADWQQLPAFRVTPAEGLSIGTVTRGDQGSQRDQLQLQRQLWLDFDGRGLSVADHLSGQLRQSQRLDVAAPWQLQRAAQDGQPLLISQGTDGRSGVELRDHTLALDAGLRLAGHAGALPTAGWQVPLESIQATLHLPYGYRLLGAPGADHSPDSWVAQWSLLDLFVVAVIGLLAGRLLGWRWALLTLLLLTLAQHEAGAPRWTLALTVALALLMRALPEGRLRQAARIGAGALLALAVLWTLPFAAAQLQYALHPQLESMASGSAAQVNDSSLKQPPPKIIEQLAPPPVAEVTTSEAAPAQARAAGNDAGMVGSMARFAPTPASVSVTGTPVGRPQGRDLASHELIQAGAGTPQWDVGNDYALGWSGPIHASQTTRLVIAPAWLVRLLRVLMVALLASLLGRLLSVLWRPLVLPGLRPGHGVGAALLMLALLPGGAHAQSDAHAGTASAALPSQALLDQLGQRLTEAPACAPSCAAVAQASLQVGADSLTLALDVAAGASVALPLPQPDAGLQLLAVSVDGKPDAALARRGAQALLRLDRGVHRVSLSYRLGAADSVSLRFVLPPQRVTFSGGGWALDGVDQARLLGDSLTLNRMRSASDGKPLAAVQDFPPYVRLTRNLVLGIDWSVENVAQRIAPAQGGFSLSLPLLPGEHPLGADALVQDGRLGITFNAGVDEVRWTSRLDHAATLTLTAPPLGERAEVWQVHAAPMWHVRAGGVPTSASDDGLLFQPLPGESLQLAITQPAATPGDSLAFDRVQVTSQIGERSRDIVLAVDARSTRGGEHAITLPAGAQLQAATRDDGPINLAQHAGQLSLPLLPGRHNYTLQLREAAGIATRTHTPAFDLHAPVANIQLRLRLPQDRWVLWTWGPTDGPAVLYWSQLVLLLVVAWLLGRYASTPLRFRHWLLLGLGFSAFAWSAYALVVLWLILLGLRARGVSPARVNASGFNLLQLGLAMLTVLALAVLVAAVPKGLLGLPDMHVAGNGSSAWSLHWFADQSRGVLPGGGVLSLPLWVYKVAMLAWALWLANALIGWLRWGFEAWTQGGYWRPRAPKPVAQSPASPQGSPPPLPSKGARDDG